VTDHKGATLTGLKVDVSLPSSFHRMILLMENLWPSSRPTACRMVTTRLLCQPTNCTR
jgi:hypothetical protein